MRRLIRYLSTDEDDMPLPPGARSIAILLAYTGAATTAGDLLLYAVTLRAEGALTLGALIDAALPFVAAVILVVATLPGIVASRQRRRWRPAGMAVLAVFVSMVAGIYLILLLHDDCVRITGCTGRSGVIYFVSFDQLLFFTAILSAWLALFVAILRASFLAARRSD